MHIPDVVKQAFTEADTEHVGHLSELQLSDALSKLLGRYDYHPGVRVLLVVYVCVRACMYVYVSVLMCAAYRSIPITE